MNFLVKGESMDGYLITDGLSLISSNMNCDVDYIGLVNMLFLSKKNTIEEYINWLYGFEKNIISITYPEFVPQKIQRRSIKRIVNINCIISKVMDELGIKKKTVETELHNKTNFSILLQRLWRVEEKHFEVYIKEMKSYYRELLKGDD